VTKPCPTRPHWFYLSLLSFLSFVLYWQVFTYNTFGPETALFYYWTDGAPFHEMIRQYSYVTLQWYRPTSFGIPYWVLEQFLGWHNLVAWKFAHLCTALATAYAIYWLVVLPLGATRMAGFVAAMYYMAQPCLYSANMEVAGFDFVHILLTVLSVGLFILGFRAEGRQSLLLTAVSWFLFVVAVTAKEAALATPGYLLIASALLAWLEPDGNSWWLRMRREVLRLLPFFAVLPAYYFFHLSKIPAAAFQGNDQYRTTVNWPVILANCRKFPLWIVRIYAWTDSTLQTRMYQSNILNNSVGAGTLLLVIVQWMRILAVRGDHRAQTDVSPARKRISLIADWRSGTDSPVTGFRDIPPGRDKGGARLCLLLMLAWTGAYLLLPVYSGGFLWHINLAVIGYSVLFGIAIASLIASIAPVTVRRAAAVALLTGGLLLSRENLRTELYAGSHATAYRINHSLLQHPPVPPAALGKAPLIYIEDRLGMGPWWYGCFGSLFKYTYLRHDLEEVIVPPMSHVSSEDRKKWLAHPNAFFFRYDGEFNWHDASAEFRTGNLGRALRTGQACGEVLPPSGQSPIRVAAGRFVPLRQSGEVWDADANYDAGKTYESRKDVAGTAVPELYQTERFNEGPFEYRFCVPNGVYTVKLRFAEIWFTSAGERIFDVSINGARVLTRFDIVSEGNGAARAIDRIFRTKVHDGRIVIRFLPVVSNPKINAIEITRAY